MKKGLMLMAVMMVSTIIFAQHHKGSARQSETMKNILSLDDAQYAKIVGINKKYAAQYSTLKNDSTQAREAKHAAGKTLRKEKEKEIKAVLTPAQNTKWDSYKTEQSEKRKKHREEMYQKHTERMKTELSLSDDQASKMKTADKNFKDKIGALKKDGKDNKDEFKKLKTEHDATVKSILNEEQFKKWTDMRSTMKSKHGHKGRRTHKTDK